MRTKNLFIHTLRENPTEADLVSHQLMLRSGMIRQLAAGIFSWLPLGWRVIQKIATIVREEMNAHGAAEIQMPTVQPAEIWQQSGRWQVYGPELLRINDRHQRSYCVGPTHEEVVTSLVAANVSSWRQLPVNLYQIQTKFRDEIRPRFGVMRAREFLMKDAYSFDFDREGALKNYHLMRYAYECIFNRIGLEFRIVAADSGAVGGSLSEEFVVLADRGEATVAYTDDGFAANLEHVPCPAPEGVLPAPSIEMEKIDTPGVSTIADIVDFLAKNHTMKLTPERAIKTMIVTGSRGIAAVILAGNETLNLAKASHQPEIGSGARLATPEEAADAIGANFGSLGPVDIPLPVIADNSVRLAHDFCCGANEDGKHLVGVNFGRDLPEPRFTDLRFAQKGEIAPDGNPIRLREGIEVGHIFYLGTKYSDALNAHIDQDGKSVPIEMGCYGIGISRIVAAVIEQHHDERGIIFPPSIAPFEVVILPLGKEKEVSMAAEKLYLELQSSGIDTLLDDRGLRAGAAFADLELLGIPNRVVVSHRHLAAGTVEFTQRSTGESINLVDNELIPHLRRLLNKT